METSSLSRIAADRIARLADGKRCAAGIEKVLRERDETPIADAAFSTRAPFDR